MSTNPSEFTRKAFEELEAAEFKAGDLGLSKSSREHYLAVARQLRRELDLPELPEYNGRPAKPVINRERELLEAAKAVLTIRRKFLNDEGDAEKYAALEAVIASYN